jgi:hypothetical protein
VGIVSLVNKERWVSKNFFIAGLKAAGKRGEDGFVEDPFLGIIGINVNRDQIIEDRSLRAAGLQGIRKYSVTGPRQFS